MPNNKKKNKNGIKKNKRKQEVKHAIWSGRPTESECLTIIEWLTCTCKEIYIRL